MRLSQLQHAHVMIIPAVSESQRSLRLLQLRMRRETEARTQPTARSSFMQKYADWPVADLRGLHGGCRHQAGSRRDAPRRPRCRRSLPHTSSLITVTKVDQETWRPSAAMLDVVLVFEADSEEQEVCLGFRPPAAHLSGMITAGSCSQHHIVPLLPHTALGLQ